MSRYVDLDEVVDAMYYDEEHEEWNLKKETIESALNHVDKYTIREWIQVSEVLPKEGTEVLVYLYNNPKSPYIAWIEEGKWFTEEFEIESEYEPTEWMPLPEPYKGGKK